MRQAQTLTSTEFKRVIAVTKQGRHPQRNCLMLSLSYFAGLRACEIASLRIADVYDQDGKAKQFINLSAEQTKGSHNRQIVINKQLMKMLSEFGRSLDLTRGGRPLLLSQKVNAFSANTICQTMCKLYDDAGFYAATSHSGRRSFITQLHSRGVGLKVIMQLANHKHLSTTQRYIDVSDDQLLAACELAV